MAIRTTFTFRPLQAFYAIGIVAIVVTVTRIDFEKSSTGQLRTGCPLFEDEVKNSDTTGQSNGEHGGWNYNEDIIKAQHVKFDDGFARRLVQYVTHDHHGGRKGPVTLGDIGAGVGQLGAWLRDNRVSNMTYHGFDGGRNIESFGGRHVALKFTPNFLVPHLCWMDASKDLRDRIDSIPGAPFHWVISIEVGEHIPAAGMDTFMDNLVALSSQGIVLTWAIKGQGGFNHINELDNPAIVLALEARGLHYEKEESSRMRAAVSQHGWLRNTIMVFRK